MNTHKQSPGTISNKKGNADTATQANPAWWNKHYASNWDRVKDAFRRNFEANRSEYSKPAATDNDPRGAVADTNRSMNQEHQRSDTGTMSQSTKGMGKSRDEITEPGSTREVGQNGNDWDFAEREGRYGFAARGQYPHFTDWNPELESILRTDWDRMKTGRSFEEARGGIRRGWDFSGQQRH